VVKTARGNMLIVHLIVDVRDSMGANYVIKMAEALTTRISELADGGKVRLRILSNLPVHRVFRSEAIWTPETLKASIKGTCPMSGEDLLEAILDAWAFADADPFRAATHNKGIMNGISAVALATGNDTRAIESGAHSFAAFSKKTHYSSLTRYERTPEGNLRGIIEIPLSLGTAGGATLVHPGARLSLKILQVSGSSELGMVAASVGLAQNFAALRALCAEGITQGHFRLHAKSVAVLAGASGPLIDVISSRMAKEGNISPTRASQLFRELSESNFQHLQEFES